MEEENVFCAQVLSVDIIVKNFHCALFLIVLLLLFLS